MSKIKKFIQDIYLQTAGVFSQDFDCSISLGLVLQIWSFLHTASILFIITFPLDSYGNYSSLRLIQQITQLFTIFPYCDLSSAYLLKNMIWWSLTIYFGFYVYVFGSLIYKYRFCRGSSRLVLKYITFALVIHSRILFFPFHYFILEFISRYSKCPSSDNFHFECKSYTFGISMVFAGLNILLALCKEISFYQIIKGRSSLSCKNNLISQLLLLQKLLIPFLYVIFKDSTIMMKICALLNLSTFIALPTITYFKLPFYHMHINQLCMIFSGYALTLSIICVLKVFNISKDDSILEYVLYFGSTFIIKIFLQLLKQLESRILRLQYHSPEQAVHLPILLSQTISLYSLFPRMHQRFQPNLLNFCGLLKRKGIKMTSLINDEQFQEYEKEIYAMVIQRFLVLLKKYPHSEILKICMAQIYLNNLKNRTKALSVLKTISSTSFSAPIKNSVESVVNSIEKVYMVTYQNNDSRFDEFIYFEYRNTVNVLKNEIQNEVSKHLEFWKELFQEKVDVIKMTLLAEELNKVSITIKKLWIKHYDAFLKNFETPLLMYGIYLQTVRDLPHEARHVFSSYFNQIKGHNIANHKEGIVESILAESAVIIVASIEPERIGKIMDASGSAEKIFNIKKENLLDQKIDLLMPNFIARRHDEFILNSRQAPSLSLNRSITTIAKTFDGEFFSAEVHLKVSPLITNGVCVMSYIKKISETEAFIIIGNNDLILDCSKDIPKMLEKEKIILNATTIHEILPELTNAITALNLLYDSQEESEEGNNLSKLIALQDPEIKPMGDKRLTSRRYLDTNVNENYYLISQMDERTSHKKITWGPNLETQNTINFPLLNSIPTGRSKIKQTQETPKATTKSIQKNKQNLLEIYNKYQEGARVNLTDQTRNKQKQSFVVKIEALFVSGMFYKVVKFQKSDDDKDLLLPSKLDRTDNKQSIMKLNTPNTCGNSPSNFETILIKDITAPEKLENQEKEDIEIGSDHRKFIPYTRPEIQNNIISSSHVTPNKKDRDICTFGRKTNRPRTIKVVSKSESREITRTLNDAFNNEKIKTSTKLIVLIVYISVLTIACLVTLDYLCTKSSIKDLKEGALIIDSANKRLNYNILSLQIILALYSAISSNLKASLSFLGGYLSQNTVRFLEENDALNIRLQNINNLDIKRIFFEKRIAFWDPTTLRMFNSEKINSIAATHVLANKNFYLARYIGSSATETITSLMNSNEILFSLNNTFNDYLVTMEQEIKETEQVLGDIINGNIIILKVIMSTQFLALLMLLASLSLLVKVILSPHLRMFKALTAIKEKNVKIRIQNLETFMNCLKENIELKNFDLSLNKFLGHLDTKENLPAQFLKAKYAENRLKLSKLVVYLLKYIAFAIIVSILVGVDFVYSYLLSVEDLTTLSTLNNKLTIMHNLGAQIDNIYSNLGHVTVLFNRTDLKIRNEDATQQLQKTLSALQGANILLLNTFTDLKKQFDNEMIENFLRDDMCRYLNAFDPVAKIFCKNATVDARGLLSLNGKYLSETISIIESFFKNPNSVKGSLVFLSFNSKSTSTVVTLELSYRFLTRYLLEQFENEVSSQELQRLSLLVSSLSFIILGLFLMKLLTLDKLTNFDLAKRRLLKIIPHEVIKENKILCFFLAKEFNKEVEGIKRYL